MHCKTTVKQLNYILRPEITLRSKTFPFMSLCTDSMNDKKQN